MTVTVMALITIAEGEAVALARYLEVTEPLLAAVGAKIVKRFQINEVVVGHRPARTVVMVEYPDRAAVDQVFNSSAYKALTAIRDRAFTSYAISIIEPSP